MVITKENFEAEVFGAKELIVLDFWATWCGPCRMLAPVIEALAEEFPNVKFGKINVDEEQELAANFRIQSIPTLVFIKDEKIVHTEIGYKDKESLALIIRSYQ